MKFVTACLLLKMIAITPFLLAHRNVSGEQGSKSEKLVVNQTAGWQYEQTVDRAGKRVAKASLASANLVPFEFPYSGGSVVTLTIRKGSDDPLVSISVSKGLLTRSFQGGRARIRFNDGRPVVYSLTAAANGRANIVFFDSAPQLIRQIKASSNLAMSLEFAGQPTREIRFVTSGLRWNN